TIHTVGRELVSYVKGAPREVLALCSSIWLDGQARELSDELRARIAEANNSYARNGLRVLAVAQRTLTAGDAYSAENVERQLTFLGLMAMMDPPRPEIADAVGKCHHAGIRIIMITGDYGLTAESIARRIGIIQGASPRIVTGVELDTMDHATLAEVLQDEVIFARVAPEHKLQVVSALQDLGHVVAVTGDGVNDAPALKKADIGVAMGISGTDVAKEAAAMILTDDNFASIVSAIEEGRAVYANIKKFTTYIFTSNTPEAVPFILFALTRGRIPLALNVMHVLAVDLGTDIVPALALGAEPPEPGVMDQPPRSLHEHAVNLPLLLRAYGWLGPVQSLAAMALAAVVTTQIGNLFTQRTERASGLRVGLFNNKLMWVGIASELALVALIVYTPFMHTFIGTNAFPLRNWLFLFAWTPSLFLVDEVRKALVRARSRRFGAEAVASRSQSPR
ncbi:MAG: cation-translocating P-type ATPase, partial [Chloroflexota bacterium]